MSQRGGLFSLFRVMFGWMLKSDNQKVLNRLLPLAREAIKGQAVKEIANAEKKSAVYSTLKEQGERIFGKNISEHVIDVAFGTAFGQLREKEEI